MSDDHWFEPVAAHLGQAYLRYSFTRGTRQEVDFLVGALGLETGMRVLDVGCGPGRHAVELARRGISVHGIDVSHEFVEIARAEAGLLAPGSAVCTFERLDARTIGDRWAESFDAAICLCQGAFGLMLDTDEDRLVLEGIARSLRMRGVLALSAFNAYFAVKYHQEATFDAERGVSQETTEIRNASGEVRRIDLWTGCYTPRELRLLLASVGLQVDSVFSVEPGAYRRDPPSTETPEFLVLARR